MYIVHICTARLGDIEKEVLQFCPSTCTMYDLQLLQLHALIDTVCDSKNTCTCTCRFIFFNDASEPYFDSIYKCSSRSCVIIFFNCI